MKKVALFSTYCDTDHKQEVLIKNIKKVKQLGLEVVVLTILPLKEEVHQLADFIIYSKENPIPDVNQKCVYSWLQLASGTKMVTFIPDYGYASLLQLKRLLDFGIALDYDYLFTMIYDIEITTEVEAVLSSGRDCSFFKNPRVACEIGGILTAFNQKNARKFSTMFTDNYTSSNFIAEEWMNSARKFLNGNIDPVAVGDEIFSGTESFESGREEETFKVFVSKSGDGVSLLFYDVIEETNVEIESNLTKNEIKISGETRINLAREISEITSLKISYRNKEVDLTAIYRKIHKSTIE
jgi:hypothetical protein